MRRGAVWSSIDALLERPPVLIASLTLLFILSFLVPVVFAGSFRNRLGFTAATTEESEALFPSSLVVKKGDAVMRVKNFAALNPQKDKDFLLTMWVKLHRLPRAGERMPILLKYDSTIPHGPGFGLALAGENESVRPLVYWRDGNGVGKWYSFSEMPLVSRSWAMFALSWRSGHLLGLHGATEIPGIPTDVMLLGGYDLEKDVVPESNADLLVGAFNKGPFRGAIGRLGIFSASSFSDRLKSILKQSAREPNALPHDIDKNEVVLWYLKDQPTLSAGGPDVVTLEGAADNSR